MPGQIVDISNLESNSSHETTPLLHARSSEVTFEAIREDTSGTTVDVIKTEARWMLSSSSLIVVTLFLQYSFFFANIISVGHLGANELSAMALSVSFMIIVAVSPMFGLLSAMDTFCSNSYTALSDKTKVGFHFQRGLISVCTYLILAAPILWHAEAILLLLRVEPITAHLCGVYLKIQVFGILPLSFFEAFKHYLHAQGIMRAGTIIVMVVAPIHWINNYIFVRSATYGIGFIGAPIVNVVSEWLMLIGIVIYTLNSRARETWGGFTLDAFHNMSDFYRLGLPAVVNMCASWFSLELMAVLISYFGPTQLAAHAIVLNSVTLVYQISNGISFAASPRVGNLIGATKPRQARIAAALATIMAILIGLLGTTFFMTFSNWWLSIYTTDPVVYREATRLMPVGCVFVICDGLNTVQNAVLRGLGHQKIGARNLLIGQYCIALPLVLYLGVHMQMEALGAWIGLCCGWLSVCALHITYVTKYVDWDDEVRRCMLRVQKTGGSSECTVDDTASSESD